MHKRKVISFLLIAALVLNTFSACNDDKKTTKNSKAEESLEESSQIEESSSEPQESSRGEDNSQIEETYEELISSNGTINGTGYEGIEGTGKYNYGEALQKSLMFYELQRSGYLPSDTRSNWRGDSCTNDGSSAGLDLTGGWYDAGDNVKFNLPMSYSAAVLAWSLYETPDAYSESGQLSYALDNIRWANEYFIKCHPEDEVYYYQVGDGNQDHSWWGACEVIEYEMNRPCYKVDATNPGSTVTAETSASLALCSIVFNDIDKDFAEECKEHAISLYNFSAKYKSDSGYTAANGFYNSWSGFYDELSWASCWLYVLTSDEAYLNSAKEYYNLCGHDYNWSFCWDDVHIGAALMLSKLTGESKYISDVEQHLDFWVNDITYTPQGLAWLDSWGSLRYATTTAFIAMVYANSDVCDSSKALTYKAFAESQSNYALGDTGRSYLIGFGTNYPVNPHHRTAQGSYCDNMNEPGTARHVLCGALVGGPDSNDGYTDEVSNYNTNEVACDYNAGFTGLLAYLYEEYHGKTLVDFGCFEEVTIDEFTCDASINAEGEGFTELKAVVKNQTAWPARAPENFELRYFIDLSELIEQGYSSSDVSISTNYMEGAIVNGIGVWDEDSNIYYLSVSFNQEGFYPGGQSEYKKEIQVRMSGPSGIWNSSNDPSYKGLSIGSMTAGINLALYENGALVYGTEPGEGNSSIPATSVTPSETENIVSETTSYQEESSHSGDLVVTVNYNSNGSNTNSISGELRITNNGDSQISVNNLKILYYFTNDNDKSMDFACYHSAVQGANGSYNQLTHVEGIFTKVSATDSDTLCTIEYSDNATINKGDYLILSFSINCSDWSEINLTNDYSYKSPENIIIMSGDNIIFGNTP